MPSITTSVDGYITGPSTTNTSAAQHNKDRPVRQALDARLVEAEDTFDELVAALGVPIN